MPIDDKKNTDRSLNLDSNMIPVGEHIEEVSENGEKVQRKGIYLLPNLFTTAALFAGFYAIVKAMDGGFEQAAMAIFVAMICDGLDGRVARLTNTQSAFGAQYDSLADMVSFGVAPALVAFSWVLGDLGKFGWAAGFLYVAGAALRLARFNTQIESTDPKYFTGLASPAAAAVVAGLIWVFNEDVIMTDVPSEIGVLMTLVTAFVGALMVTNVPYSSFKGIDLKGRVPFVLIPLVVLVFGVITLYPAGIILLLVSLYALSGPVLLVWRKVLRRG